MKKKLMTKLTIKFLACAAALALITPQNTEAAFIVEAHSTGRAFANFSSANGTATPTSTAGTALGLIQAGSVFGNGTYTFSYTLGTDADNFTPTIGANLGNGNLATGAAGGVSGNYNVYVSWINSTNINAAGTKLEAFNDGATVEWPAVNQNNLAPANVDFPGVNKWWCIATNVPLTAGNTYTVVSTPNTATFVAQRFAGVMWERIPEAVDPCTATALLTLTNAPYVVGTNVTVAGVSGSATKITIYQNTGSGMTEIGSKTADIIAGTNIVTTTTPLAKGAILAATQTIGGQEGCVPSTGPYVGGGANPSVRIAVSIRETAQTGPVGAPGTGTSPVVIHFLGASALSANLAPINAEIVLPTNEWQTVTIGGKTTVASSANAVGTVVAGNTYNGFEVAIQVHAFKTNGTDRIYSATPAQSSFVISNENSFAVNWTWDAVADADGYRVLRDVGNFGFFESIDVETNSLHDTNNAAWGFDVTVTPTSVRNSPTIQWFGQSAGVINTNGPQTPWGLFEGLGFAIDNEDTGAFDLYIDNIQNGETVFQTFETAASGAQDYLFRAPSFSATTSSLLLNAPNLSRVTNLAADTGTNSTNVRFQWKGTNTAHWLRLTTDGTTAGLPQVNLDDPISFRLLLLPVGASLPPVGPPGPISITKDGSNVILSWPGTATLQSATDVAGPYDPVVGATSPHTNSATGQTFYRLAQ